MPRFLTILALAIMAVVVAACGGKTTGATNVDHYSATLNYEGHCDPGDSGDFLVQYRVKDDGTGPGPWQDGPEHATPAECATQRVPGSGEAPLSDNITGLDDGVTYQYRAVFRPASGGEAWVDSTGTASGTTYHEFSTPLDVDTDPPSTPSPSAGSITQTSAVVSWAPSTDTGNSSGVFYYETDLNGGSVQTVSDDGRSGNYSRTFSGLTCGTSYTAGVKAVDAVFNESGRGTVTFSTSACDPTPPASDNMLGLDVDALSSTIPSVLTSEADQSATPGIGHQDSGHDTKTLAAAIIYAKTGSSTRLSQVCDGLDDVQGTETSGPFGSYSYARALAVGRGVQSYAIAADLVDAPENCPNEAAFRSWLDDIRTFTTQGGPSSLIDCHEDRPNNWGTHCGASRMAADVYLGDTTDLADAANVFRTWVGDSGGTHTGFNFGDDEFQADPANPVGINPVGATISGCDVDGVLPDDQRRDGGGTPCSPGDEGYVYEALQGIVVSAFILEEAGYPAFSWGDEAIRRAFQWQIRVNSFPAHADGDDAFLTYLANRAYGLSLATGGDSFGKGFGAGGYLAPGLPAPAA